MIPEEMARTRDGHRLTFNPTKCRGLIQFSQTYCTTPNNTTYSATNKPPTTTIKIGTLVPLINTGQENEQCSPITTTCHPQVWVYQIAHPPNTSNHTNSAGTHSSRPSQRLPHQLPPSSPAPNIQYLGAPRSTMMPAARTPQLPLTLSQLRPAVNSSFDRRSVALVQVQWQTPTVVNNVDALALHTAQPPPLFMPSPQPPTPELPFNPPSASLGPSAIDPANVRSSSQELLSSSIARPTSPQTQHPVPIPLSRSHISTHDSHPTNTRSSRVAPRDQSKTPPPSSMGPAVQQNTQWSRDTPAPSEPVSRPRMGKGEKALKTKVSDTDVVQNVTEMLDRHDEDRRKLAQELGISETRIRNLIGVHERYRADKKPSAYNAAVHWKADQLNAGRAVNDRATLEELHIAVREDTEMCSALETWRRWKEEKARKKAAKKRAQRGVDHDEGGGAEGEENDESDDEGYDDYDEEDGVDDGGEGEGAEGNDGGTRMNKQTRAQLAEVRRWFEALEVSKAEKFVGNRGSTKSVKKEGNVGVNHLNRVCENLSQKTGGMFWGFACRNTYNTAIVPGMYGDSQAFDDYLMEKQGISAYEFISSIEAFVCEQALHGAKAMTVEKMKIWIRSKLERSLRETSGDFNLTMKYKNYEVLIVEPYKVQLVGWPDHIPFINGGKLNNTLARDLYNRLKSESIKWVKMRPQEYQRWRDNFERRLKNGELQRPKRAERSDKGGTHNTSQANSKKRQREPADQEEQTNQNKSAKTSTQPKQKNSKKSSSASRKSTSKTYKSRAIISDSDNDDDRAGEEGGSAGAGRAGRPDDQRGNRPILIGGENDLDDLDEETRREIEADPDADIDADNADNASRPDVTP
ncbi:hypothetical protein AAF712_002238 [Marasmius tenuissimus]|uniref:Uncharacterized protein n=1 Tax=Marasmius tenuissimus TaxID=585030 RepID=A0ABR3ACV6_9AGAR